MSRIDKKIERLRKQLQEAEEKKKLEVERQQATTSLKKQKAFAQYVAQRIKVILNYNHTNWEKFQTLVNVCERGCNIGTTRFDFTNETIKKENANE